MAQPSRPSHEEDPTLSPDTALSDDIELLPLHVALPHTPGSSVSDSETDDDMDDDSDYDPALDIHIAVDREEISDEDGQSADTEQEDILGEDVEPMQFEYTGHQQPQPQQLTPLFAQQRRQSPDENTPRYASWAAMVRGEQNPQPLDIHGVAIGYAPPPPVVTSTRRILPSIISDPGIVPTPLQLLPPRAVPFPRPAKRALFTSSESTPYTMSRSSSVTSPPGGRIGILHLPNEVLDLVLRYLSSRPRATELLWETISDACDAMAFATTCTRLYALFRSRLVSVRTRPERYREDLLYTPPTAGVVIDARTPQDVLHLSSVLRLAGPVLQELIITRSLPRTTWVDSYVNCVTNLRKLSLRDVNVEYPLERILEASSGTLKELEIVGATGMALSESQLYAMSTFCTSIHTLALRLSMFDHDWTNVWMGIGPGLVSLSLGATRFWIMDTEEDELLDQIGRYCVDIRHLRFYHLGPTLGAACSRLCRRYGNQLETLELEQSQLLRPDIEHLAAGCPDTRMSVSHGSSLFSHAYNVDVIDLLGPQITTLRYRSQLAHDESLWEVGRKCRNLRELRLDCASTLTEAALKSILQGTAGHLHNVSMSFFVRGLDRALASSALLLLAKHARELRELYIGGQKFDLESLGELAKQCRGSLQKVGITFGFRTAGEREIIETETFVGVVQALYVCEKLKSLVIVDRTRNDSHANSEALRQACYPLRARASRLSICGVDYVR